MATRGGELREAFESRDLERVIGLMDERVLWRGLPIEASDPDTQDDHDDPDDDDHHYGVPLCVNRDEVRGVFEQALADGFSGAPVILAEVGDSVVVDPQAGPLAHPGLHQVFTFRGGRIVLIQDYADRSSALADLHR